MLFYLQWEVKTALNVATSMYEKGMLEGVKFLGAHPDAIKKVKIDIFSTKQ